MKVLADRLISTQKVKGNPGLVAWQSRGCSGIIYPRGHCSAVRPSIIVMLFWWPFGVQTSGHRAFIQKMYSRITAHTKSWNAFFRIRATSFLPQTAGKEQRVWPLCELVRFDDSIWNRNLSISRLLGRFLHFMTEKRRIHASVSYSKKIKTVWKDGWRLSKNYRFSSSLSIETTLSIECWRKTASSGHIFSSLV